MDEVEVSAVIPVYNDREALAEAIPKSLDVLAGASGSFELLIAEDGSSDGSALVAEEFSRADPRVRLLHSDERLGRGEALSRSCREARGEIVCYYDVDLATDMGHLPALIDAVRQGCDVATGSRLLPESVIKRSGEREMASRGYNTLVRAILKSTLRDHQCGFKAFRRDRLLALLPRIRADHWFWDTEVLVRAQRLGWKVCELPVRWRQGPGTTVRVKDVVSMGSDILRLWWQLHAEKD